MAHFSGLNEIIHIKNLVQSLAQNKNAETVVGIILFLAVCLVIIIYSSMTCFMFSQNFFNVFHRILCLQLSVYLTAPQLPLEQRPSWFFYIFWFITMRCCCSAASPGMTFSDDFINNFNLVPVPLVSLVALLGLYVAGIENFFPRRFQGFNISLLASAWKPWSLQRGPLEWKLGGGEYLEFSRPEDNPRKGVTVDSGWCLGEVFLT